MKKVFMSFAVVALMVAAVSCACNNNQPAATEENATECAGCDSCTKAGCDSCTKACCDTTAKCDSAVVAE